MSATQCLRHEWLAAPITNERSKSLMNKNELKSFMARVQWKVRWLSFAPACLLSVVTFSGDGFLPLALLLIKFSSVCYFSIANLLCCVFKKRTEGKFPLLVTVPAWKRNVPAVSKTP